MSTSRVLPSLAIFVGSFLLFDVQPMLGRTLLPSFGGTAAVWVVCLCAFQVLLLAGYGYTHVMTRYAEQGAQPGRVSGNAATWQRRLHIALLALAVLWTLAVAFLRPALKVHVGNSGQPAAEVLLCVLLFAGLPYVLLSSGATMVQAWVHRAEDAMTKGQGAASGTNVYRLYAISNLGSFCGLMFYPFFLEPYVSLTVQWYGFAIGLALYALLLLLLARQTLRPAGVQSSATVTEPRTSVSSAPCASPAKGRLLWLLLPAASCFLLNAVTTHLSLDVMALPLLWVVLLGAFLMSYVLGFGRHSAAWMKWGEILGAVCLVVLGFTLRSTGGMSILIPNLIFGTGLILFGCAFLHGWLYRLRPEGAELTRYYLFNALGGALGGTLASLVAPLVFRTVAEYPIALFLFLALAVVHAWSSRHEAGAGNSLFPRWVYIPLAMLMAALVAFHTFFEDTKGRTVVFRDRGFYGTVLVSEIPAATQAGKGALREFIHGSVVHGTQVQIPGKFRMPTAYFTPDSGGLAITQHPKYKRGEPMRVGVLGLGIGVLVAYSRTNDYYRCYEISPEVMHCARNYFTFLKDSPAQVDLAFGDARKAMEQERAAGAPRFDVLFVDAFTGDNLPAHLSTQEAFQLYFDRLQPDGILAVNVSNWHLNLFPLVRAVSDEMPDIQAAVVTQDKHLPSMRFASAWAFMMRDPPTDFTFPPDARMINLARFGGFKLPTDEKGSFVSLINF